MNSFSCTSKAFFILILSVVCNTTYGQMTSLILGVQLVLKNTMNYSPFVTYTALLKVEIKTTYQTKNFETLLSNFLSAPSLNISFSLSFSLSPIFCLSFSPSRQPSPLVAPAHLKICNGSRFMSLENYFRLGFNCFYSMFHLSNQLKRLSS